VALREDNSVDVEPNPGGAEGITHHITVEENKIANCGAGILFNGLGVHDCAARNNSLDGIVGGITGAGFSTRHRGR
jgi:hypothetical protein